MTSLMCDCTALSPKKGGWSFEGVAACLKVPLSSGQAQILTWAARRALTKVKLPQWPRKQPPLTVSVHVRVQMGTTL